MQKAFVTGYPVRHSRSPLIHGHWLARYGIDGSYERIEVAPADFPPFLARLKCGEENGFVGGNVTIPHKEAAFALADRPDGLASALGAANTLWVEDGVLHATNTDGYGFLANLDACLPGWDRTGGETGSHAVVLGAGGASRAIIQALSDRGFARIDIVNRTIERAERLAERFGPAVAAHPLDALREAMRGAALFVNTTSLGMDGEEARDIDFRPLSPGALVTDIVYAPLVTPLLRSAADQGFRTVDGLGMLLHQAVPGFERWFGIRPEVTGELRALVVADLEAGR